jgi:hypothetical protein
MAQSYKKIRYMMENAANLETIKTSYTKFRVEGYPEGYVNQPARGASIPISLIPFTNAGNAKYITKMSGRAFAKTATLVGGESVLNIDSGAGGSAITGSKAPSRFKPAKITIFVPKGSTAYAADSGTTSTGKTVTEDTDITPLSAVRGLKYNRRLGNSYTYPFGYVSTAGQNSQLLMQGYLYIKCAKAGASVTFTPEIPG